MPTGSALQLMLSLAHRPTLALALRRQPLPADITEVIRIAADDGDACRQAAERTGRPPAEIKRAAVLFLRQILLHAAADEHRVLGVSRDASREATRANAMLLLKWLHPDRNQADWAVGCYARVMDARRALQARSAVSPPPSRGPASRPPAAAMRSPASASRARTHPPRFRVAWIARPLQQASRFRPSDGRRLGAAALAGSIALAVLLVPNGLLTVGRNPDHANPPLPVHATRGGPAAAAASHRAAATSMASDTGAADPLPASRPPSP